MNKKELAAIINEKAAQYKDYTAENLSKLVKIKSLSGDDWKKLKNKRKSERKARKDQHKKKKK